MLKSSSVLLNRFFVLSLLCVSAISSVSATEINIIPFPQQLVAHQGQFVFSSKTRILCNHKQPEEVRLAQQFAAQLKLVSDLNLKIVDIIGADTSQAILFQKFENVENPEAYRLSISDKTIRIEASAGNGFFYGLQTLYQLLPSEIYAKKKTSCKNWSVPAVEISDSPRFSYRGVHLDVARHFFTVEFIKKYIDALAIHKINYFHWHLTDDQGWRIEIKQYPRLTEIGSKRDETLIGHYYGNFPQQYDGKSYSGFYTQAQAREIVSYAAQRFITVIPEIEMPGHAQAAIASYPYLSCTRDSTIKTATRWGIFKEVFCPRDTTFQFLENVLTEILAIFPSKYIHIGGDECPKDRWKTCADCQALIKREGLKDENELQSYFIHRIEKFLNSKGRQIIGWDEILDGGLAPNATVMSWRGTSGGIAAAKAAHDVIMTPGATCYFDRYQANPATEPLTIGGFLPLKAVYQYEPIPSELTDAEAKHILGAQANVWTEYIQNPENVEYMAFPRVSALAEVLWSSKETRNWDSFSKRMLTQFNRYRNLKINSSNAFFDVQYQTKITDENKLQITLSCDCPDAEIHYSIHGKTMHYTEPITLSETADITAIASIHGKQYGKKLNKTFIISKLTGLQYSQNLNNTWYDGGSKYALTDGIQGNTVVTNQWVGIGSGRDAEIIIDLKDSTAISRFSVGLLHATAMCVVYPSFLKLYGSINGTDYNLLCESQIPISNASEWEIIRPELTFTATNVRFLKLQLQSGGNCTMDSPDFKEGSKIFMDEISAW